jgi:transposase
MLKRYDFQAFSAEVHYVARFRDKLKVLFWHTNGFWLWYRRLERQRFWWPNGRETAPVMLSVRELNWLLEGLDPKRVQAHQRAEFGLL